jgi:hydroxymethylpyrimidine pyrophosphatase-like HAD family hydrolase/energy-coupling factor transporter ATP-binding protein EcfA2
MFFVALAVDYDGTIARDGRVDAATLAALEKVKKSGRKLILVTGRDLDDLQRVFPEIGIFNLVVAENGALLFDPETKEEELLAAAPADKLIEYLHNRKVAPLSIGRCIVATWEPNETIVLEAIRDLGLELHIIFNKGAVMVLPAEINKASGLKEALKRLQLSPYNVVGIGDAENDQAFLRACGCSVAVANALPTVKENADFVVADHGAGVAELAKLLIKTDLSGQQIGVREIQPVIGESDGRARRLNPFETVLVTGSSGGGKSTVVTALLEQMITHNLQFCVVDPEGDYAEFPAVMVGDAKHEPGVSEIMDLLAKPDISVVVNLLAIDATERPRYLAGLMPELSKLRISTGRPHWIVLDEAHHCLPAKWDPAPVSLPQELPAAIAVTVHPEEVSPDFLKLVSTVVGVGDKAEEVIQNFCAAGGYSCADFSDSLDSGDGLIWTREEGLRKIALVRPQERQKRHVRKYAEGELGEDKSFYFRGPNGSLNLRAHNLVIFLQMAQGVDDQTWTHHLRLGEYSRWFGEAIKDDELAAETRAVEQNEALSAQESRERIKEIVERRYTAPAKSG